METINRITANGGTWIADRSGFVSVGVGRGGVVGDFGIGVFVDDTEVFSDVNRGGRDQDRTTFLMPVRKGQTVRLGGNLSTGYYCYYIPPLLIEKELPEITEPSTDAIHYMAVPDYANKEDINRWAGSTTSWTVENTGFCICYVREGNGITEAHIYVNGVTVAAQTNASHTPATNFTVTVMVKKGDVISRWAGTDSAIYCYYCPPVLIKKQLPELIEPSDENIAYVMMPDYSNMGTQKLLTSGSSTYTFPKSGFIYADIILLGGVMARVIKINGNDVARFDVNVATDASLTTLIPVKKGDVLSWGGNWHNLNRIVFIPPLLVKKELPVHIDTTDEYAHYLVVPDYANMETTNRLTAYGQTWTVQQTGFIVATYGNTNGGYGGNILINDKKVASVCDSSSSWNKSLVPVKKGDVVKITGSQYGNTEIECYFIPPILVEKELPRVVEKNGSYSLSEVRTDDKWTDGKWIYRKTIVGVWPSSTGNQAINIWLNFGNDHKLVKLEGTAEVGTGVEQINSGYQGEWSNITYGCRVEPTNKHLQIFAHNPVNQGEWDITAFYTKNSE
jgi:hypothetical protein